MTVTYEKFWKSIGPAAEPVDLLADTEDTVKLRAAAEELSAMETLTATGLADWLQDREEALRVLGLSVGLGKERLASHIKGWTGDASIKTAVRKNPGTVVDHLDRDYGLIARLALDRNAAFRFADIVVARSGTRGTAARAAAAGRGLEDRLEEVAESLGLEYRTRGRFTGTGNRDAPFDLAIVRNDEPVIVVAAKAFDSTGSKLTDAVREVQDMANVRKPTQFVFAAVDGLGWLRRDADLRRLHELYTSHRIDGLYTAAMLDRFRQDLIEAARRLGMEVASDANP